MKKSYEYCNECNSEVQVPMQFRPQRCPECNSIMFPCNLCPLDECVGDCPAQGLIDYADENNRTIITKGDNILINHKEFRLMTENDDVVNKQVFWLDPLFWRNEYHSSDYHIVDSVCADNEIVRFEGGTEAWIDECYIPIDDTVEDSTIKGDKLWIMPYIKD